MHIFEFSSSYFLQNFLAGYARSIAGAGKSASWWVGRPWRNQTGRGEVCVLVLGGWTPLLRTSRNTHYTWNFPTYATLHYAQLPHYSALSGGALWCFVTPAAPYYSALSGGALWCFVTPAAPYLQAASMT